MEQYDKAYEIAIETKGSYQNGALVSFALASEKLGKTVQAEEYFLKAAKRYPNYSAPDELALYYLRQEKKELAYKVLKEYERYNEKSYYYGSLIDHYEELDAPQEAISIVKEVNKGNSDLTYLYWLAHKYNDREFYGIAAEIFEELAKKNYHTPYCAALFFNASMKAKVKPEEELFKKALSYVKGNMQSLSIFGVQLIEHEYFDKVYAVFEEFDRQVPAKKNSTLLILALSWKNGSKLPEQKTHILEELKKHDVGEWYDNLVKYILGDVDEKTIFSIVNNDINRLCEVHYFTGFLKLAENKKEEAIKHFLLTLETRATVNVEYKYADDQLKKLVLSNEK